MNKNENKQKKESQKISFSNSYFHTKQIIEPQKYKWENEEVV